MTAAALVLEASEFRRLSALLEERCGLSFHAGNRDILDAGLARLAESERLSVDELAHRLHEPAAELFQKLVQAVTICETYFFRHPEQFALLSDRLVPQLLRSGRRRLRAWSAGCATGEEAYSLAVTLATYAAGVESTVLGTDINQAALRIAAAGRYGRHSLRAPSLLLDAYLLPVAGGEFTVAAAIRQLVSFAPLNLREPDFRSALPGDSSDGFDIIFCRNVLVYFAPSQVAQVLARLRDCLAEGGYLVVSALDYLGQPPGLELLHIDGVPVLRRSPAAKRSLVPPSALPRPAAPPPSSRSTRPRPAEVKPSLPPPSLSALPATLAQLEVIATAKAAADEGQLDRAAAITRNALSQHRSPEALHLLALILGEQGQLAEAEWLLLESVALSPSYVLGYLSLGLLERPAAQRGRSAGYLNAVLERLHGHAENEVLPGPERLQVAMARRLALAGLAHLEGRP